MTTELPKEMQRLPDRPSTGGRIRERMSIVSIGSLAAPEPEPVPRNKPSNQLSRQSIERRLRSRTSLKNKDAFDDVDGPKSRTSESTLRGTAPESLTWRPSAGGLLWQNSSSDHRPVDDHNASRITGLGISWSDQPHGSDDTVGRQHLRARPLPVARGPDASFSWESRQSTLSQGIGRSPLSYRSWRDSDQDISFERSTASIQFPRASPPRITSDVGVMRGVFANDSVQEPYRTKSAPFVKKTFFGDELAKYISADSDVIRRDAVREQKSGSSPMSRHGSTVTSMRENFIKNIDTDWKTYQENRVASDVGTPWTRSPTESTTPIGRRSVELPIRSSWRPAESGISYETDQPLATSERPQYHRAGTLASIYDMPEGQAVESRRASEVPQYLDDQTLRRLSDAFTAGLTATAAPIKGSKPTSASPSKAVSEDDVSEPVEVPQPEPTQRELAKSRHPGKLPLWKQLLLARAEREAIEGPSRYPRRSSSDLTKPSKATIPPRRDTSRDFRLRRPNANVEWIKESYEFKYRQHRLAVANGKVTCYYLGLQPFSPFLTSSLCRAGHYFSHPFFSILCHVFNQ